MVLQQVILKLASLQCLTTSFTCLYWVPWFPCNTLLPSISTPLQKESTNSIFPSQRVTCLYWVPWSPCNTQLPFSISTPLRKESFNSMFLNLYMLVLGFLDPPAILNCIPQSPHHFKRSSLTAYSPPKELQCFVIMVSQEVSYVVATPNRKPSVEWYLSSPSIETIIAQH